MNRRFTVTQLYLEKEGPKCLCLLWKEDPEHFAKQKLSISGTGLIAQSTTLHY